MEEFDGVILFGLCLVDSLIGKKKKKQQERDCRIIMLYLLSMDTNEMHRSAWMAFRRFQFVLKLTEYKSDGCTRLGNGMSLKGRRGMGLEDSEVHMMVRVGVKECKL